jgi:hypothetical protein
MRALIAAALAAAAVSGCTADSAITARALVVPGKFDALTCPEIAAQIEQRTKRITELTRLMETASRETVGYLTNGAVHAPVLAEARAERRILEETQVEKNCGGLPKTGRT